MATFTLYLFLFVFSTTYLTSIALFMESLVSKRLAPAHKFTYQVAIMGMKNGSNELELQCGGGIINSWFILAAAQCFIDEDGNHKTFTFSIIADTIDVNDRNTGIKINFSFIYLPKEGSYALADISVSKLENELDTYNNPNLSELGIPHKNKDLFVSRSGTVAGYGFSSVTTGYVRNNSFDEIRTSEGKDGKLRFEDVTYLSQTNCKYRHREPFSVLDIICGRTSSAGGICQLDTGSPFVIDYFGTQWAVGVASSSSINCKDHGTGGLYTKVAEFAKFVKGVLRNELKYGTLVYQNRKHHQQPDTPLIASFKK